MRWIVFLLNLAHNQRLKHAEMSCLNKGTLKSKTGRTILGLGKSTHGKDENGAIRIFMHSQSTTFQMTWSILIVR